MVRYYEGFTPFGVEVQGTAFVNVHGDDHVPSTKEEFIEQIYKAANLISLMGIILQKHEPGKPDFEPPF